MNSLETVNNLYNKIDSSTDVVLEKTQSILDKITDLTKNLFNFLKNSIKKDNLKKVLFIILMSFGMAVVLMGIKILKDLI
uniref:Uncharacterized protein n=1 Tax=viral metagenome TaxID=1070528 RepID=A0A6C0H0U9_9ZZZZ